VAGTGTVGFSGAVTATVRCPWPHARIEDRLAISDLSLTSDGRELVFLAVTKCIQNRRCEPTGERVRA
jgi:hypothetical protein